MSARPWITVYIDSLGATLMHGTASTYTNGKCRCQQCKDAWARYSRDRRAVARAQLPDRADPPVTGA